MGSLGFGEMAVIALAALLVFGPERLPELARQAGKALARFRRETSKSVSELKRAAELEDLGRELAAVRSELRQAGQGLVGVSQPARRTPTMRAKTNDEPVIGPPPPTDPDAT